MILFYYRNLGIITNVYVAINSSIDDGSIWLMSAGDLNTSANAMCNKRVPEVKQCQIDVGVNFANFTFFTNQDDTFNKSLPAIPHVAFFISF